jgi:hypothetical protein
LGRWWRRRRDGSVLGLRWGLGCWQWHRVGGRPENDEVGGVDPAESTFCPDPVEDIDIDIDLHTGGGPIWPSHRLWRDNPEQRAYNESCPPNK